MSKRSPNGCSRPSARFASLATLTALVEGDATNVQQNYLAALPAGRVEGLYVHIPFCFHKCHYCDFYSITRQTPARMEAFVDLILREAAGFVGKTRDQRAGSALDLARAAGSQATGASRSMPTISRSSSPARSPRSSIFFTPFSPSARIMSCVYEWPAISWPACLATPASMFHQQ